MNRAIQFYNSARIAIWVFRWLFWESDRDSLYRLCAVNSKFGNELATVLIGRNREAWRVSHLAIEAWRPK